MISNETEYKQTLKWIEKFEKVAKNTKAELIHNPILLKIELDSIENQLEQLVKEVRDYEQTYLRKAS
jgi:hypothetical protein